MGEAEGRGSKGRSRQKKRRKGEKEKTEERENDGNKKDSRRVGNMRGRGRSDKVRSRSEEVGTGKIS